MLEIGASTGPAAIVPLLLCEFHQANPSLDVRLSVHDTQTVVSLVAERELELGIVGAAAAVVQSNSSRSSVTK